MPEQPVERKLAAILAADIAGYSRLVGRDEEGTLARLRALRRELIDPTIAEHRGRIFKTTGDGMLVEFASVVDAVRCAIAVQRATAAREAAAFKSGGSNSGSGLIWATLSSRATISSATASTSPRDSKPSQHRAGYASHWPRSIRSKQSCRGIHRSRQPSIEEHRPANARLRD